MRISGTEHSLVILSQKVFSKVEKRCPKRAKTRWSQQGWCNKPTTLQFSNNLNTENVDALNRYESTEVDRRTWLHEPSGTHWSTSSDIAKYCGWLKFNWKPIFVVRSTKTKRRRSDPVLWHKPLHQHKYQKGKVITQTTSQKSSIKQRLRTDLGRSVGVTTATQLVWLTTTEANRDGVINPQHYNFQTIWTRKILRLSTATHEISFFCMNY